MTTTTAPRKATSIRLSAEADRQLGQLAATLNITRTAVLELAVRVLGKAVFQPITLREHWCPDCDSPVVGIHDADCIH
jgi:predicted transcriptional regulator